MRVRSIALLAALALVVSVSSAWAQSQTGEIFGKVTDESGAVLPGVQVTLTSPVLLQPLSATTSETGSFQFPRLDIGTYTVKFELAGFKTIVKEGIQVTVGFNAQGQRADGRVDRAGDRHGHRREPDRRHQGDRHQADVHAPSMLQSIPSARDPWVILQQTAGIAMDRENIGGNMSGQQSNYVSRGGEPDQQQVVARRRRHHRHVRDRRVAELLRLRRVPGNDDQHRRRGRHAADRRRRHQPRDQERQRPVPRARRATTSPTRSSSRNNISDDAAHAGRDLRQPDPEHQGLRRRSRRPDQEGPRVGLGQLRQAERRRRRPRLLPADAGLPGDQDAAVALAASINDVNNCLNTDRTLLQTTNLKGEVQLFKGNKLSLFNNFAKKERNARGADDLHPIETTTPQGAVPSHVRQALVEHRAEPDLQVRRPVGRQRPAAGRCAVRARRQQLHARLPRPDARDVQPTLIVSSGLNGRVRRGRASSSARSTA